MMEEEDAIVLGDVRMRIAGAVEDNGQHLSYSSSAPQTM